MKIIRCWTQIRRVLYILPGHDESIALVGYSSGKLNQKLLDVLKKIKFPEPLSAIFHIEKRELEVVWTAYKLTEEGEEIRGREFEFSFEENCHKCRFDKSSEELLCVAEFSAYLQVSKTSFRNLQSFSSYAREIKPENSKRLGDPISFFIGNVDDDYEYLIGMIRHLNFYLRYYDSYSPHIVIHDSTNLSDIDRHRYIEGSFPKKINARKFNPNLLSFWIAAYDHEVSTQFLLYYRILEYVSGIYLQSRQRNSLTRAILSPTALSKINETLDQVASIVREDSMSDFDRYIKMFEELVEKEKIWAEICANPDAFTKDTTFDGGLELKAVVSKVDSIDNFGPSGMHNIGRSLRAIRNALAHGGEAQAGRVILPTRENFSRLLPWVHIASIAAGQVLIYEHLT